MKLTSLYCFFLFLLFQNSLFGQQPNYPIGFFGRQLQVLKVDALVVEASFDLS